MSAGDVRSMHEEPDKQIKVLYNSFSCMLVDLVMSIMMLATDPAYKEHAQRSNAKNFVVRHDHCGVLRQLHDAGAGGRDCTRCCHSIDVVAWRSRSASLS